MGSKVFTSGNWERPISPHREERMDQAIFFNIVLPDSKEVWADIGCGPGYFAIPLAGKVQKVYAVDISREMLDICSSRANKEHISNIAYIESDSTDIVLNSHSVDKELLVNVYHEFPSVENVIREMSRILKPGGHLYVIDWRYIQMESGPPLDHRVPEKTVIEDLKSAGFLFKMNYDIYEQNYVLEFIKRD